jgi:exopolyphosphatase/pppGpp-phosphohydrolase
LAQKADTFQKSRWTTPWSASGRDTKLCPLADIGRRAHLDDCGEQLFNVIANAAFAAIDHPGPTFLALAVFFRHASLIEE